MTDGKTIGSFPAEFQRNIVCGVSGIARIVWWAALSLVITGCGSELELVDTVPPCVTVGCVDRTSPVLVDVTCGPNDASYDYSDAIIYLENPTERNYGLMISVSYVEPGGIPGTLYLETQISSGETLAYRRAIEETTISDSWRDEDVVGCNVSRNEQTIIESVTDRPDPTPFDPQVANTAPSPTAEDRSTGWQLKDLGFYALDGSPIGASDGVSGWTPCVMESRQTLPYVRVWWETGNADGTTSVWSIWFVTYGSIEGIIDPANELYMYVPRGLTLETRNGECRFTSA